MSELMTAHSLVINVRFEGEPTFSGISPITAAPYEWPPAPARLLSALIAGAAADPENFDTHLSHLRVLETLPNPVILACTDATDARDPLHYAPKVSDYPTESWTVDKVGDLAPPTASRKAKAYENSLRKGVWPGFKGLSEVASTGKLINGARTLAHPEVTYFIVLPRNFDDQESFVRSIDTAAQGISYFGASRDTATVTAYRGTLETAETSNRHIYHPLPIAGKNRGWAPGLVDHLILRHEHLTAAPTVDLGHPDHITPLLSYQAIPPTDMVPALSVAVSPTPPLPKTAHYLEKLHDALESTAAQAHIIPLVNHLHENADGRLKGILVVPNPITREDGFTHIAEAAAALINPVERPWLDATTATTQDDPIQPSLKSLTPSSVLRTAASWRSATPIRSYPGTDYARARLLIDLQQATGLSFEDISLTIRPASAATRSYGQVHTLGETKTINRAMVPWHITVDFAAEVSGPIQIGSDTRLGYGLLVPTQTYEPTGGDDD